MTAGVIRAASPRSRLAAFAGALAAFAGACGNPPESAELVAVFSPAESDGPSVNRIVTTELVGAATDADQMVLVVDAVSIERLFGGSFALTYDPTLVTVEEVQPGALLASGHLVSSLGGDRAPPGELHIGFAMNAPAATDAVSGTLVTVAIRAVSEEPSEIGYRSPPFWLDSRVRALVAADGVGIAGTRWLGGTIDWIVPE